MKKTLIAALIAGIPAVAAADVTIYGSMRGALENTNTFGTGSENGVNDYTSRIGFKGSEDLGNGLKAIWKVESRINLDGGEGTNLGSRETYMGLASDFGTLRMGRINNTANDLGMLDVWEYGLGVNGLATFTRTGSRLSNSIRYDSPAYYGFTASVGHSFAEDTNFDDTLAGKRKDKEGKTYLGLNYENGPFAAYYAAETQKDGHVETALVGGNVEETGTKRAWTHRLEGTYTANNLFVGAGLQYATGQGLGAYVSPFLNFDDMAANLADELELGAFKTKEAALTVGYTLGNLTPKITYAKGWDLKADAGKLENTGYDQWIVGADYALSKRTTAFASYGQQKFDEGLKEAIVAAGGKDTKIKTFAVGMRHDF